MMVWFRWFSSSTGPVFSGEPAVNLPGCKEIRVDNCFSFSSSPLLKVGGMQLTYPKFRSPGFFWLWPVLFGGFKWPFLCWWPAFGRWKGLLEKACMFFFKIPSCWPFTHLESWIEREVRLEDIFLCQPSGEGSYGDGVPVFFKWRVEKTNCQLPWPSPDTEKKIKKSSEIGEGNHQLSNPRRIFGHEIYGGPKNRGKKRRPTWRTWWVGCDWLTDIKDLDLPPPPNRMQDAIMANFEGFFVGNSRA